MLFRSPRNKWIRDKLETINQTYTPDWITPTSQEPSPQVKSCGQEKIRQRLEKYPVFLCVWGWGVGLDKMRGQEDADRENIVL